jgi:immune inhibitor A
VNPTEVTADIGSATIQDASDHAEAFKLPISATEYFLIENRQKNKFDANLAGSGLLIWHVNETVVNAGLANNSVNADENDKGVDLEEADGQNHLDSATNRGDAGDPFPGSANKRAFDGASVPASSGTVSVCSIGDSGPSMTANLRITNGRCGPPDTDDCSSLGGSSAGNTRHAAMLLLLPLAMALYWIVFDRKRVTLGS